jgi:hypothetical protein
MSTGKRTRGQPKNDREDRAWGRDSRQKQAEVAAKAKEAVPAKKPKAKKPKAGSAKKTSVAVRPWPPEASGRTWRAGGF